MCVYVCLSVCCLHDVTVAAAKRGQTNEIYFVYCRRCACVEAACMRCLLTGPIRLSSRTFVLSVAEDISYFLPTQSDLTTSSSALYTK